MRSKRLCRTRWFLQKSVEFAWPFHCNWSSEVSSIFFAILTFHVYSRIFFGSRTTGWRFNHEWSCQVMIGWLGMGLTELVNLNVLRIFRVIRLLRAGRLLIIVPELYILVSGLATSMKVACQELTGAERTGPWNAPDIFGSCLIETSDVPHEIAIFMVRSFEDLLVARVCSPEVVARLFWHEDIMGHDSIFIPIFSVYSSYIHNPYAPCMVYVLVCLGHLCGTCWIFSIIYSWGIYCMAFVWVFAIQKFPFPVRVFSTIYPLVNSYNHGQLQFLMGRSW